jgi:type II secretory pathway pseudopilin PulG
MLIAIAVSGALLAAGSVVWSQQAQRDRERELLLVGKEFQRAIGLYYERTPGAIKRYPERLEDLLRDERYPSMQRYLRRIYRDPMTGRTEWGLVSAPTGGIMGVYSLSRDRPIKTGSTEGHTMQIGNLYTCHCPPTLRGHRNFQPC